MVLRFPVAMKDRTEEMHKNTFAVVSVACFLALCFVTFFNTYRMLLLETEVQELREGLKNCDPGKILDSYYIEKLNQFVTRNRRSIVEENHNPIDHKVPIDHTVNISRKRHSNFKGISPSESPLNTIFPDQKGGITKKAHHNGRTSKVMQLNLKSLDTGSYSSNEFTSSESEFPIIRDEEVVTRRPRPRMQVLDERHPKTGRIKPLPSIHLSGDTSKYVLGTHQNFKGNGHLTHLQSIFVDWKPSQWVEKTGMMTHFGFDEGYLTIKESGLYLIYAQIYYLDEHDVNGYRVYRNGNTIFQCTVSLHTNTRSQKGNTCYTAGVEYVAESDKISLGDIVNGHYSLFEPGKSFFGVVKLGDIRARIV